MAHQIYQDARTGKASVFVVGEPAWHKLGKTLSSAATAEEAIKEAGLDFEVKIVPNLADLSGIPSLNMATAKAKSFSTVRTDTGAVLGSRIGGRYAVLQNVDAFKFFDAVVDRGEAVYHSGGTLGKGERIWVMAKLPEHISIKGIDEIEVYVTMFSSHDTTSGISSFIHTNRIVCNNTLQAAMEQSLRTLRYRHTGNIVQAITEGAELMGIHNMLKNDLAEAFDYMVSRKIATVSVDKFLKDLFPAPAGSDEDKELRRTPAHERSRESVLAALEIGAGHDMITSRGTGFGLYNAVTYYIDNMKWEGKGRKKSDQERASAQLKSSWFGGDAAIRQKAFDLVMAL